MLFAVLYVLISSFPLIYIEVQDHIFDRKYRAECVSGFTFTILLYGSETHLLEDHKEKVHIKETDGMGNYVLHPIRRTLGLRMDDHPYLRVQFKCERCMKEMWVFIGSHF